MIYCNNCYLYRILTRISSSMLGADSTTRYSVGTGDACGDVLAFPPLWEEDVPDVVDGVVVSLSISDSSSIPSNTHWSCSSPSDGLPSISWTSSSADTCSDNGLTAREAREITLPAWQNIFLLALTFLRKYSTQTLQTHVRSASKRPSTNS